MFSPVLTPPARLGGSLDKLKLL
ncbi:hypothetical protein AZE42_13414, partial [Rhizopogon vesiculosus]